ncbi:MAG: class I SAM-dependent methyltransferase [Proteobacteria bacterium]|nr:class I SAM-dependent methyltransferase [Pseudomonadota bacterium]MBU1388092.1 class I SAM-dependent methyltransferase [Pseudomonadota bacterium]MBU1542156.1 class I SAM-dependent methyltransferase [Pseudomonadota bacterium]MBU2429961.1 class I SAM-dependent methyltransferase [Pseudomonadota bacterium]MBU2481422.1 class I SAM-dependent methyltransferase [Pseudomonadota bacterium]
MNTPIPNQKYEAQGQMLANKVKKKYQHLRRKYARQGLAVFRLYDWDIPEIRAVVDWYDGHLVIAEYQRDQTDENWLPVMATHVGRALNIPEDNIHLKLRKAGIKDGQRYERIDYTDRKIPMQERDLKFYINPDDYVDTGLFSDHRNTRLMVRELAKDKKFLNLYCYTGAFTCYAAKGGASQTVSVDRSQTSIRWAKENLELNDLFNENHILIQEDTLAFLKTALPQYSNFDLAVVDPPSYSTTQVNGEHFDIAKNHPEMLNRVFVLMNRGATVFFSTNHQNFDLKTSRLIVTDIKEITEKTIPEDYVNKRKQIHRCWEITI